MPEQDDFWEMMKVLSPFVGVAGLAGVYGICKRGFRSARAFALSITASLLAGFVTGALLISCDTNQYLIAACCAISGAMGDRAIQIFQRRFEDHLYNGKNTDRS